MRKGPGSVNDNILWTVKDIRNRKELYKFGKIEHDNINK
jgi:hypothetical protein